MGQKSICGVTAIPKARAFYSVTAMGSRSTPTFPPGNTFLPTSICWSAFEKRLVDWALHRRRHFVTIDELAQEYLHSRATACWVRGEHDLMARSVLRKRLDGDGYELVCDPENEAAIYAQALTLNLWPCASESRQADRMRPEHTKRRRDRPRKPGARV